MSEKIKLDDLISESSLAGVLDLSCKTLKNRIARGEMPMPIRLPGSSRNYFLRGEIERWLASVMERRPPIGQDPRRGPKSKSQLVIERHGK